MSAHVFQTVQEKAAFMREEVVQAIDGEQQRSRENVLLDKIHAFAELIITRVGTGDELKGDQAVAL